MKKTLVFSSVTKIDENLAFNPSDFWNLYLFGVPRCYSNGDYVKDEIIEQKLKSAQRQIENTLSVKLTKQICVESKDFVRNDHFSWGFVRTNYPVNKAFSYQGFYSTVLQVNYPQEWLSVKKDGDQKGLFRTVHIVPNYGQALNQNVFIGLTQATGFLATQHIPNYWLIEYCTGFDEIPDDILEYLGKWSSIHILNLLGEIIAGFGINSQSISFDGFSQSVSKSNPVFQSKIGNLLKELEKDLPILKDIYKGFMFDVM